ncbi:MAG: glycoside hydrolase family 9 protein [Cyanobacteriota bacterium]|nr:glycoside hydrolase family 9 protein [Cyanobacteriota bacterium]
MTSLIDGLTGLSLVAASDDTLAGALALGLLNGRLSRGDSLGPSDTNDYVRFEINQSLTLSLSLEGLGANANLELLDGSGSLLQRSANGGTTAESLSRGLAVGTYYARVTGSGSSTPYTLTLTTDAAGNTRGKARGLGNLLGGLSLNDWVGGSDANDYYRLDLAQAGNLGLSLNGLAANADLQLLNGVGTVLASSSQAGTAGESLSWALPVGTAYVRVFARGGGNTNYSLNLSLIPADAAGNNQASGRNLGALVGNQSASDWVGSFDTTDYYTFSLPQNGPLTLSLSGLTANADVELLSGAGTVLQASANGGTAAEAINIDLAAGAYAVRVLANGGDTGYTLSLSPTVGPDYATALSQSFLFYEAQRSGDLPSDSRVAWRRDSALGDANARLDANNNGQLEAGESITRDLSGGYYDAGDRMKYAYPMASAMTLLGWGMQQFQPGYNHSGQLDEAQAALRWGTDWLLKAHETTGSGTNLQTVRFWAQVGRTNVDHNTWSDDLHIATPRPAYALDASHPGSDMAASAAAALACASMVFRGSDNAYATTLLDNARALYRFAYTVSGVYSNSIPDAADAYRSSGINDDLAWGAIWLHRAIGAAGGNTGETLSWAGNQTYLQVAKAKNPSLGNWTQSWGDQQYGTAVLLAQADPTYNRSAVEDWLNYWTVRDGSSVTYTNGGLAFLNGWGSLRYAANTAFLAAVYGDTITDYGGRYTGFAKSQIDYILGDNPRGSSYVVGYGASSPRNPHHAHANLNGNPAYNGSNGWDLYNANSPNHNLLVGALVGGPASANDFDYVDTIKDYQRNEVTLDYNAAFTGVLAYLHGVGAGV